MVVDIGTLLPDNLVFRCAYLFSYPYGLYLNNQIVLFQVGHSHKGHKLAPRVKREMPRLRGTIVSIAI